MTAPKGKTSKPTATKPSDIVKANIERQRRRSDDTREGRSFEGARSAEVFATYQRFKKSELPVTALELARLAMVRAHDPKKSLSEITDRELDDLLQFIARCQWRIEATKHFWNGYGAAFYEEDRDEAESSEIVKRIREENEPIPFARSLVLLGIPERPQREGETANDARTRRFRPIFAEWYIAASRVSHVYGDDTERNISFGDARPLSSWTQPTKEEIRAAFEARKREGWPDRNVLEIISRYVEDSRKKSRSETNAKNAKSRAKTRRD
jgi:hypothetical protein